MMMVSTKITTGKTSSFLFRAITEIELLNKSQLRLNLLMAPITVPFPCRVVSSYSFTAGTTGKQNGGPSYLYRPERAESATNFLVRVLWAATGRQRLTCQNAK